MEIRFAQNRDIPGILELLKQVGAVHHGIRPDIFRTGAQKYDDAALQAILADPNTPVFVAVEGLRPVLLGRRQVPCFPPPGQERQLLRLRLRVRGGAVPKQKRGA